MTPEMLESELEDIGRFDPRRRDDLRAHIAALEQQNEQTLRLAESQSTAYGEAMARVAALEKERDAALARIAELEASLADRDDLASERSEREP